jgi:UDP-GlcNAc:undecaprenyl-phosphate GlcNAc-1-phosphate transferase
LLLKYIKNIGNNNNSEIRWNDTKKSTIGGSTFYVCFLISSIALLFITHNSEILYNNSFYGIMFAVTLGFITGLIDDVYSTIPKLKLLLQVACAFILFYTGIYIQIFELQFLNLIITVFWVVGIMNAINLIDNMDAISTVVSIFIIGACIIASYLFNNVYSGYSFILIGAATTLFAFLLYNWHPSKFFMGDTGTMFLGVFLATFGILFFWNFKQSSTQDLIPAGIRFLSVITIFALPIIDTSTVFIKRLFIQKKSPFIGGKDHTTHHLSYLGLSDRMVAVVFILLSALCSSLGLLILWLSKDWKSYYYVAFGLFFVVLFTTLFTIANMNTKVTKNEIK